MCQTDNFTHSDDEKYGENIYAGELTSGHQPVDIWYWECDFDYSDPERSLMGPGCGKHNNIHVVFFYFIPGTYYTNSFVSGHFTAMVWKETKEIGLGIYPYDDEVYVVVASFFP